MTDQELTKLIAEKVMGWENFQQPYYPEEQFHPLTNEIHTWQVVDKMIEKGFGPAMSTVLQDARLSWAVTFDHPDNSSGFELLPDRRRAICLAALRAVGEVVE